MCSWCWGFTPVLEEIKSEYQDKQKKIRIALILGGLQPGETEAMLPKQREEILHHWQEVEKMTGQPFKTKDALPPGFIYNTEPSARAVVTMAALNPEKLFPYFKTLQSAFYADGKNITKQEVLVKLASTFGVDIFKFTEKLLSEEIKMKTKANFLNARKYGMLNLPSTVLQDENDVQLMANGYCTLMEAKRKIDIWLNK